MKQSRKEGSVLTMHITVLGQKIKWNTTRNKKKKEAVMHAKLKAAFKNA